MGNLMKQSIDGASEAAVAVAAAYVAAPEGAKVSAAAAVAAPVVWRGVEGLWRQQREDRRIRYLAEYLRGEPLDDPGVVEAQIDALSSDPKIRDIVFDSLRVLDDARCNAVVLAMARLTRKYKSEGWPPDVFSRGVRRLLADLTSDGVAALREVLEVLKDLTAERDEIRLSYFYATESTLLVERFGLGGPLPVQAPVLSSPPEIVRHVLELLKTSGLARTAVTPNADATAGPVCLAVALSTARGVLDLLS
jgi:hypothetical protein